MYSVVVCSCGTYHTAASPRRKPAQAKFEKLPAKTSDSPLKPHSKKRKSCNHVASTTVVNQHTHLSLLLPYNTSLAADAHRTARGSQPDRWSSQHSLAVGGFFEHEAGAHTYEHSLAGGSCSNTNYRGTNESQKQQPTSTYSFNKACEYLLV